MTAVGGLPASTEMRRVVLGRTGLEVGVVGLGCGGDSRLGQCGEGEAGAARVVARALGLGIDYFDTAQAYGTEAVVGRALRGVRDDVVIATKIKPQRPDGRPITPAELAAGVTDSLRALGTDRIDVCHLHSPRPAAYRACADALVPELLRLRERGLIRYLALSEAATPDPAHAMLRTAVADGCWDVMLVGFSLVNQSARNDLLTLTAKQNVGVVVMAAARGSLHDRQQFTAALDRLVVEGTLPRAAGAEVRDLLGRGGPAARLAYTFARDEPGVDAVLVGTSNVAHLEEDVVALCGPPLEPDVRARLVELLGHLVLPRV